MMSLHVFDPFGVVILLKCAPTAFCLVPKRDIVLRTCAAHAHAIGLIPKPLLAMYKNRLYGAKPVCRLLNP